MTKGAVRIKILLTDVYCSETMEKGVKMQQITGRVDTRPDSKYYQIILNTKPRRVISTKIPVRGGKKTQAAQMLRDILYQYNYEHRDITRQTDLCEYLKKWLEVIEGTIQPTTYASYKKAVYAQIIPYFTKNKSSLQNLNGNDVTLFLKYLRRNGNRRGGGLSMKSVKIYRGVLSKALNDAMRQDMIPRNPVQNSMLPTSTIEEVTVHDTYALAELQTLLTSAKKNDSSIYLFLLLVAMTGCRKGEILGLTWDKVDFANQTIAIVQNRTGDTKDLIYSVKRVKTKTSNRIIYVSDELTELLKKEKAVQEENQRLFGNQYQTGLDAVIRNADGSLPSPNHINEKVYKAMERAGVKKITVHELRHTYATICYEELEMDIKDISRMLGHSELRTTQNIYIHQSMNTSRKLSEAFFSSLEI